MKDRVYNALTNGIRLNKPMFFSVEWLNETLAELPTDEEKLAIKILFLTSASDYLFEDCYKLSLELIEIAQREKDTNLEGFARLYLAFAYRQQNRQQDAIAEFKKGEELVSHAPRSFAAGIAKQMFAFNYWANGDREKAFALAYEARELAQNFDWETMGWSNFQLGVFHSDMQDYENAMKYFIEAKEAATKYNLNYQLARINSGIASIHIAKNELDQAIHLNEKALNGYRSSGHQTAISRVLNDLGVIYFKRKEIEKAKENLSEALMLRRDLRYWPGIITSEIELARIYMAERDFDKAEHLLLDGLAISNEAGLKQKAIVCHQLLGELYKADKNFKAALDHLENGHRVKSELAGEEVTNRIKAIQQKHATEQADKLAELERKKNVELKQAYDAIEEQNTSILDSINYARRIQAALLGSHSMLSKNIAENFVLYMPKDIVSGDFWWCEEEKDEFYFAVADCTGHGVPGAFMSLLNINLLTRALADNENAAPAKLLNEVRRHVIASLNKEGNAEARDGMDVVLCSLNKTGRLRFACANNALLLIRKGELQVHGPDKFPVGLSHTTDPDPFTEFEITLQKGDCVYLSTDGFADQFGGAKGKKYKQKRLREFLQKHAHHTMKDQEQQLGKEFESWRGNLEQVDDVLVLGFRY
jgi:serine phosphatase RsbU (regulator of sigma subunit)